MFVGNGFLTMGGRKPALSLVDLIADMFDASAGAWYDPSRISTLWQNSARTVPVTAPGDPVGAIDDISGNGRHLLQSTSGSRPTYQSSGGLSWIETNGSSTFLRALFTIAQPYDCITALRINTLVNGRQLIGGGNANAGVLYQTSGTGNISLNDGSDVGPVNLAVNTPGVITERHAGANSRIAKNRENYATGNGGAGVPGGLTIGQAYNDAWTSYSAMRFYGRIQVTRSLSDSEIEYARRWCALKAGVLL